MVEAEAADFVKGDEDFAEELLVLQLQWKGEAVDDATKDLEQLTNPVKVLRLIDESGSTVKVTKSILFCGLWAIKERCFQSAFSTNAQSKVCVSCS